MAMPRTAGGGFDSAVIDKENRVVALVQVKAGSVENWGLVLSRILPNVAEQVEFILAVDLQHIFLYRPEGQNLGEPIVRFDTPQILKLYDPGIAAKRVFYDYLVTLAEAWLRDLAYHWKSENPPGSEELKSTGLLERIAGGTTVRPGD